MKIIVDSSIPEPSDEEKRAIEERSRSVEDATPEERAALREQMIGIKQVIIPQHIIDRLAKDGITADELVAMLLKKFDAAN